MRSNSSRRTPQAHVGAVGGGGLDFRNRRRVDKKAVRLSYVLYEPISCNPKRCRLAIGLSQREIAKKAGVPLPTIRAIEQSVTIDPLIMTVVKLVRVLGVTMGQLLGVEILMDGQAKLSGAPRRRNRNHTPPASGLLGVKSSRDRR